jgi:ketosteroid isomerase-like protein
MRVRLIVSIMILSMIAAVSCTTPGNETTVSATTAPVDGKAVQDAIAQLERDWVAAILAKDTATVDRLLVDDFIGTTNDARYDKADAIEDVQVGTHELLELDNIDVRVYGDSAVATMDQQEKSHHGSEDFSGHYLFTNFWVKQNGEWRAIASHGSRIR